MTWSLFLVLASAVLHASWNLLVKRHPDPNAGIAAVAGLGGLVGLSAAMLEVAGGRVAFPDAHAFRLSLVCGVSEAAYFLCLGRTLRDADLSLGYVVSRGGAMLMLWPLAFLVQREAPTLSQAAGVGLMVAALVRLYPVQAGGAQKSGYRWALATALFIAANHVAYKQAIAAGAMPMAVYALAMAVTTPLTVLAMGPALAAAGDLSLGQFGRVREAFRRSPVMLVAAGLMCGTSFGLALEAMRTSGAAWVGTLRNASVALAPLLAWAFLGERPTRRALGAFALVVVAIVLLSK